MAYAINEKLRQHDQIRRITNNFGNETTNPSPHNRRFPVENGGINVLDFGQSRLDMPRKKNGKLGPSPHSRETNNLDNAPS